MGIGFAIPINSAMKIAEELRKTGQIDRGYSTGLVVQAVSILSFDDFLFHLFHIFSIFVCGLLNSWNFNYFQAINSCFTHSAFR